MSKRTQLQITPDSIGITLLQVLSHPLVLSAMPQWLGSLSQQMGSVSPLISHYQKLQGGGVRVNKISLSYAPHIKWPNAVINGPIPYIVLIDVSQ